MQEQLPRMPCSWSCAGSLESCKTDSVFLVGRKSETGWPIETAI